MKVSPQLITTKLQAFLEKFSIQCHLDFPVMEVEPTTQYATKFSSGFDISSLEDVTLEPKSQQCVRTGLHVKNPENPRYFSISFRGTGFDIVPELQIRPKSGLACKRQLTVTNAPGTVDADFPQEICVILYNLGSEPISFQVGDRIAQGVFAWSIRPHSAQVADQSRTSGFGSTGQ